MEFIGVGVLVSWFFFQKEGKERSVFSELARVFSVVAITCFIVKAIHYFGLSFY